MYKVGSALKLTMPQTRLVGKCGEKSKKITFIFLFKVRKVNNFIRFFEDYGFNDSVLSLNVSSISNAHAITLIAFLTRFTTFWSKIYMSTKLLQYLDSI
jgi:hypothetical protein